MRQIFLKTKHFEGGLRKSLAKGNFIFSFKHSPFYGQDYKKRDLELVTCRSSGYKAGSENSFISDVLPDQVN